MKAPVKKPVLQQQEVKRFGDLAQRLIEQGYRPLPIHYGKKNPNVTHNWTEYTFQRKDIAGRFSHRNDGTGILTGKVTAADIDIRNKEVAAIIEALAEKMLGKAPRRIGLAPKVLRIYKTDVPFPKITSNEVTLPGDDVKAPGYKKHRVEILGVGQQFVAYNQHPDTGKPYIWNGEGDPLTVPVADLVSVTEAQMREFIDKVNAILKEHAPPADDDPTPDDELARRLNADAEEQAAQFDRDDSKEARDPEECRSALRAIPNADLDYDSYIKIGHSIANALGAAGEDAWHEWAKKSGKYEKAKSDKDWQGFMKTGEAGKLKSGAGTIYLKAKEYGWKAPRTPPPRDSTITMEALTDSWLNEEPPPQDWLWQDIIPMGSVTTITAQGGTGKTFFTLRLAEACTHGSEHFFTFPHNAKKLRQGTVVFVNAEEDPGTIRRRLWSIQQRKIAKMAKVHKGEKLAARIAEYRADLRKYFKKIHLVGKQFSLIDMVDGQPQFGPGLEALREQLRTLDEVALVILDPMARLHNGDENSNAVSTMLISAGESIAQEFHCAVLMSHHVSKDVAIKGIVSGHSGRGGAGFGDGARSVMQMTIATPGDAKGLRLLKEDVSIPDWVPIDPADVANRKVILLHHPKANLGPEQRTMFLLRADTGELLPLKVFTDDTDPYTTRLGKLSRWLAANPMSITKSTFRDGTALRNDVFGTLSRKDWELFFDTAIVKGDLVKDPDFKTENPNAVGYKLAG
jgi:AAA domain/Primase C terminal 2 (PriCT-2)/Bifunctional DNA primase/polymerase, N-terminal